MPPPPLILNVDHDVASLRERSGQLRAAGFDVIEAANGAEAARLASEVAPAVVFLDVTLPDIDRFDAWREQAAAGGHRPLVLHLTSQAGYRALEQQLLQSQKMESIGRLAGGIAHDFNNILTAIMGFGDLLIEVNPGAAASEPALEIQKAAERAAGLTRRLLAFSRRQAPQVTIVDVNTLLGEMDRFLHRVIGEDIELTIHRSASPARVRGDGSQLHQVILNLVVNARDVLPRGGTITVASDVRDLDAAFAAAHRPLRPGRYVTLVVSENGPGMTDSVKQRLFEPFFTTKPEGQGTGIGLALVYGIVKQLGGYIWVDSQPGEGAAFRLYLPATHEEVEVPVMPVTSVTSGTGTCVLVAEDDDSVRSYVAAVLRRHGYTVLVAEDAENALRLAGAADHIDLLVTDIVMPRMSGRELSERLRERRPGLPTLFMSGYTQEAIVHYGVVDAGVMLLHKPFSAAVLLQRVTDALTVQFCPPPSETRTERA